MQKILSTLVVLGVAVIFVACGGGGGGSATPTSMAPPPAPPPPPAGPLTVTVEVEVKQLNFSWTELPGSTHYRLLENADGNSGFTQVGADIPAGTLSASLLISVHSFDFTNALFIIQGCDAAGCTNSTEVNVMNDMLAAIGQFESPDPNDTDGIGGPIALSEDGTLMAVGAPAEASNATGINGDQNDNSASGAGAVFVYRFDGTAWTQEAYLKASNAAGRDEANGDFDPTEFGGSVALSADGNTLAVGSPKEDSGATGINGDQNNKLGPLSGAAYVFRFNGTNWFQEAYIKASNTGGGDLMTGIGGDRFGVSVSVSEDGNTLAVGAVHEESSATGIGGDQNDNSAPLAGAAYIFRFDGTDWFQQAYVKASNTDAGDEFGGWVSLDAGGNTLAVGNRGEDSNAVGINGDQNDNSADDAGAVHIFRFDGTDWAQTAYLKASNTDAEDGFGWQVALSADGANMVVAARGEDSLATGVGGDQSDNSGNGPGAVYAFQFDGTDWSQTAYIKASNANIGFDHAFGTSLALSVDGTMLAVGDRDESSCALGVGGDQNDNGCGFAGAAYVFRFDGADWAQTAYVKAPNRDGQDQFGRGIALNGDGAVLAVGASSIGTVFLY